MGADNLLLVAVQDLLGHGWRLGYVIAPAPIIERAKKVHDFLTVGAAAPLQEAIIPGLRFGQDYYDDLLAKYTHKRDLFCEGLDAWALSTTYRRVRIM